MGPDQKLSPPLQLPSGQLSPWHSLRLACAGIDYNPCMVAAGPLGALLVAEGIGINPQLITVGPSGAVLVALGTLPNSRRRYLHADLGLEKLSVRLRAVTIPQC